MLLSFLFGLGAAAIILLVSAPPRGQPIVLKTQNTLYLAGTPSLTPTMESIIVHVMGEVKSPGLLTIPEDSRVNDAILSAGGLTELADVDRLNLAAILKDGTRIYVPAVGEILPEDITNDLLSETDPDLVNINLADRDELADLPGIGLVKADAIIAYRTSQGDFLNIEEILNVPGIGESIFDQIKDLIKVEK